jgi:hypothetical protein
MKTTCADCGERTPTTTREGQPVCAQCAVEWDKPVEMHEPTIERVRRDVEKYKCQAAWLDTWALLRMFDQLREDVARLTAENADLRRQVADELSRLGQEMDFSTATAPPTGGIPGVSDEEVDGLLAMGRKDPAREILGRLVEMQFPTDHVIQRSSFEHVRREAIWEEARRFVRGES